MFASHRLSFIWQYATVSFCVGFGEIRIWRWSSLKTWRLTGSDTNGAIMGEFEAYPFTIEDGQAKIRLPFFVDEERLTEHLAQDGWAVANGDEESAGSKGWGPDVDLDGYYPCWVFPDEAKGETTLAFPPRDYRGSSDDRITAAIGEVAIDHQPYFGPQSLDEFSRWLPYLKAAAR